MEKMQLTSIRLSKEIVDIAIKIGKDCEHIKTSDVLRVALWIGLKFMNRGVLSRFLKMMWREEVGFQSYSVNDVIRTAGVTEDDIPCPEI